MKTQDKLPQTLLYRLEKIIPARNLQSVLHAFTVKRPTTIRVNTLKTTARVLRNLFFEKGIKLQNVVWYKNAFIVQNKSLKELKQIAVDSSTPGECKAPPPGVLWPSQINLYENGYFYVQSLSSMIPPLVLKLNPQPNEKILDMCAAPGGKTTQMAAMMENKGEILANDINSIRLEKLKANLTIQGVTNTFTSCFPDEILGKKFEDFFDKTLVDVPCSGEGRINIFKPETYKGWNREKVKRYSALQKRILLVAVKATKPGGRIVYSTCTLSPEENEEVIDWILEKEKGNIIVEKLSVVSCQLSEALMEWEGKTYNKQIVKTIRILPSNTMEGFFIACLRKK